jgi:CelD/BcsL family acetyltransferase involved in cellulose biosynthesis
MTATTLLSAITTSRARLSSPARDVQDVADRATLVAMESEWNSLVSATSPEPFYRHEYIRSFLDNFLPNAPLKILTTRDTGGRLSAILPLVAERGPICGIKVRQLASPTNVHSLRFDLIADNGEEAAEAFWRYLAADRSWDVVRLTDVPEGGEAWQLHRAAQEAGFPVGAWESQRSPYIVLPSSYRDLMQGLRTKFKANLRRRRKRLGEKGAVTVERLAGASLLPCHLEECFALERSGWKGRGGSAVSQSPAAHGFHSDLLRRDTFRNQLSLFLLKLDGQPIAFHYGLTCRGVYSLVMTSYDESFKDLSPGHLLTEEVLKDCIARGLREFDFLGCDLPWKLDWTATVRSHHWLFIFRDSPFGRALCEVKFGWFKAARRRLGNWLGHLGRIS